MNSRPSTLFIYLVTLFYICVVTPFVFLGIEADDFVQPKKINKNTSRNENSTPRNSILPASTAIAMLDLQNDIVEDEGFMKRKCSLSLLQSGHNIAGYPDISNFDLFFETTKFQQKSGLPITGVFDQKTRAALKC